MTGVLKNAWYVAAFADELRDDAPLARLLLGERIVLFADAAGKPIALSDRCPHRFAQLHGGTVVDGTIQCPYHGLRFDRSGRCVHSPHHEGAIPDRARVRSYSVHASHGLVWIWMGDPTACDFGTIPDLSSIDLTEPRAVNRGYMHTPAHYELVTDNLLDLSHADYIHRRSLNTGGSLSRIHAKVQVRGRTVEAYWRYVTETVQPLFESAIADPAAPAVQSFRMLWLAPSNLLLTVTARNEASPEETAEAHVSAHLLTPETERSTHYFVLASRTWKRGDAVLNEGITAALMAAFTLEDKPMLETVQESMGTTDLWELEPVILPCDRAPVHARRMLARLIREEGADTSPSRPAAPATQKASLPPALDQAAEPDRAQ